MTDWRTYGDVPLSLWRLTLRDAGSDLHANFCYDAAKGHTALCLAMLGRESRYWTRFFRITKAHNNPLNLRPPDGDGYLTFSDPVAGIRAWRERITSRTYKNGVYARTTTIPELVHVYAPSTDDNDEAGYVAFIEEAFRAWGVTPKEQPPMGTFTDLPFFNNVIGIQANAPNIPLNDSNELWITVHETANTNVGADAEMHYNFVRGGGGESRVSFTFAVDDHAAFQILRADRIGYHASDGCDNRATDLGCFASVAIETCVNADGNWSKTKDNLAKLLAMIVVGDDRIVGLRKGAFSFDRIGSHRKWAFDSKWCPRRMLDEGSLPVVIAQARQYAGMGAPTPYAKPITYDWLEPDEADTGKDRKIGRTKVFYLHQVYTVVRDTPRKQATGKNHELVGPRLKQGEQFAADYVYRSNGVSYVLTRYGTRVQARDLLPRVAIATSGTITVRRNPA